MNMHAKLLTPVKEETLKPSEFVQLTAAQKDNIESSRFIPPTLGQKGFGGVRVTYIDSVLRPAW